MQAKPERHDGRIAVSVVIPVYNTERYLRECLDSLAGQTLSAVEVLCVNDMSTDGSLAILEEYARRYPAFRVLSTGRNRGQAYARNLGLDSASGDYVYFLDSDDYLSTPDALEWMLREAETAEVDCVCFDSRIVYETERLARLERGRGRVTEGLEAGTYGGQEYFCRFFSSVEYAVAVWRQFWRRNVLLERRLYFQENTSPHEDLLFTFQAFLTAKRIRYLPELPHTYRYREGSSMTSVFSEKRFRAYGHCYGAAMAFLNRYTFPEAVYGAVFRFLAEIRRMLEANGIALIQRGADLNADGQESPMEALQLRLLLLQRYPYLDRMFTPGEYQELSACEKVIIYGAGKAGNDVRRLLDAFGISNYQFAATAPGKEEGARSVVALDTLTAYRGSGVVILAATEQYQAEMRVELERLGFRRCISLNTAWKTEGRL